MQQKSKLKAKFKASKVYVADIASESSWKYKQEEWWDEHGAKLVLRIQKAWKAQAAGTALTDGMIHGQVLSRSEVRDLWHSWSWPGVGRMRQLGLRRESTLANSTTLCAPSAHLCVSKQIEMRTDFGIRRIYTTEMQRRSYSITFRTLPPASQCHSS